MGVDLRALRAEAEHARDRVAPDVGVEHADALALGGQRGRQVGGQRGLADAALARADADDVRHLRERALRQAVAAELALQDALLGVAEHVEVDVDARWTPSSLAIASRTATWKWLRIGQPGVVSETVTSTTPSAFGSMERTISSSTMLRRSSGSMTTFSASRIWSREGMAFIVAARR